MGLTDGERRLLLALRENETAREQLERRTVSVLQLGERDPRRRRPVRVELPEDER